MESETAASRKGSNAFSDFLGSMKTHPALAEISRSIAPGAHGVLILDGAGWHGAAALVIPDNLSLLTLPPYSPDLNPVGNV